MRIPIMLTSKISSRVINTAVYPRVLLDTYEEDLVDQIGQCDCQPVGETNVIDCDCYEEWEEYELLIGDEIR
jgi:hypothetical protein